MGVIVDPAYCGTMSWQHSPRLRRLGGMFYPQTVPIRNFQGNSGLLISKVGLTFHGAGRLSAPLTTPLGCSGGRSCRIETACLELDVISKADPLGLPRPGTFFDAIFIIAVIRRNLSNKSSLCSCPSLRGSCVHSLSRKCSKVFEICNSAGSHPGMGDACNASFPRVVKLFTRLSQSMIERNSYWVVDNWVLLSRNCSIERRQLIRVESWKPDAHGVLSRSESSRDAAHL